MGVPLVSIILPSLRPSQLARCLASIERYSQGIDYEVVVVSPFDIKPHPNVVHVKEVTREGAYKAVASGYEQAKGEYIIHIPDDSRATPLWAVNMVAFMRRHDDEIFLGAFRHLHATGELPEITIYRKLIAQFLCIRRDKVDPIGGLMDCYYKSCWGDADLSLRVWHSGGRVETCPNAWIYVTECKDDVRKSSYSRYLARDQEAFFQRWYHIYAQPGEARTSNACKAERRGVLSPELPPEECVKFYVSIHKQDWKTVKNILMSENSDACIFPESVPFLYNCVLKMLPLPGSPKRTLYAVLKWLYKMGYFPSLFCAKLLLKDILLAYRQGWHAVIYFALRVVRFTLRISGINPSYYQKR